VLKDRSISGIHKILGLSAYSVSH